MKTVPKISNIEMPEKYKLYVYLDNGEHVLLDLASLKNKGVFEIWEHGDGFFSGVHQPPNWCNNLAWRHRHLP